MSDEILNRYIAARELAGELDGSLSEIRTKSTLLGYALNWPRHLLYETPNLADIERRLAEVKQAAKS